MRTRGVEELHARSSLAETEHRTGPVEDREVVVLLFGVVMATFVLTHLSRLKSQPSWQLLLGAVFSVVFGWSVSVVEHFVEFSWADLAEHGLYAAHSLFLLSWVVMARRGRRAT